MSPKTIVYLRKSTKPDKKYMVCVDGKTIHFGARGMSDFTKHKDVDRMKRYSARHARGGETWGKSGLKTAGFWSKWLLWNKPTLSGSRKDISSRFGVTFRSGWPTKSSKSTRKALRSRKSTRKSRKSTRKSRKSRRKSTRKSRRKSTRKSRRKSTRKSRRKSTRKARKSRR
jgi:hypothetical protein